MEFDVLTSLLLLGCGNTLIHCGPNPCIMLHGTVGRPEHLWLLTCNSDLHRNLSAVRITQQLAPQLVVVGPRHVVRQNTAGRLRCQPTAIVSLPCVCRAEEQVSRLSELDTASIDRSDLSHDIALEHQQ